MTLGISYVSPAGEGAQARGAVDEASAERNIADKKIPLFSCERPCVRGQIARRAADLIVQALPSYARAHHAASLLATDTAMTRWVTEADKIVMIDGCFLKCDGGVLKALAGEDRLLHIVALPLDKNYSHAFLSDNVPDADLEEAARQVADKIVAALKQEPAMARTMAPVAEPATLLKCWWPNCDTLLREDVSTARAGEPDLEHDHTGYYITCPKCGARSYPPQALCYSIAETAA